jgi:proton-dependent oligopeptide transporter, POT family
MSQNPDRLPPQTKYIVGNEACERFSFYGVVSILTGYATIQFGGGPGTPAEMNDAAAAHAKETVHWFKMACYAMPLVGAWIADRLWGRYNTILWLSLAYCVGHGLLALGENTLWGMFAGLAFIAIGSGGIKPCVSAFVGDQFGPGREHQLTKVYNLFYWSINFGALFAFSLIPMVRKNPATAGRLAFPGSRWVWLRSSSGWEERRTCESRRRAWSRSAIPRCARSIGASSAASPWC